MSYKRILTYASVLIGVTILVSCKSKEEKAAELIKSELSKTLYDFDSYQPIETIVKEARGSAYNDSLCWDKAAVLAYGLADYMEKLHSANAALEHAQIWGIPTSYSSSYSDRQFFKYMVEFKNATEDANLAAVVCNEIADTLAGLIRNIDTTSIIGWEVQHSFRCKTRGGSPEIANYRFVIDKDFKTVIIKEDTESKRDIKIREAITKVVEGWNDISLIE